MLIINRDIYLTFERESLLLKPANNLTDLGEKKLKRSEKIELEPQRQDRLYILDLVAFVHILHFIWLLQYYN